MEKTFSETFCFADLCQWKMGWENVECIKFSQLLSQAAFGSSQSMSWHFTTKVFPSTHPGQNLALGKATYQSSTWSGTAGAASKAVDGNSDVRFNGKSCTATAGTEVPWFVVDLGESASVKRVVIVNRGDCCREYLSQNNRIVVLSSF